MVYLDYSATTFVDKEVLDCFVDNYYIKNYDYSLLKKEVQDILKTNLDVIFTSGASESNNMAIFGVCKKHKTGHIITTKLEHSSVLEGIKNLEKEGFRVSYVPLINGVVDLDSLDKLICDDTLLVSIASVSSEIGLLQPIEKIAKIVKKHKNVLFHCDITQSIGKVNVNLDNVDLASFSSHKIYAIKGAGVLLKRKDIVLQPIMYGDRYFNYGLLKSFVFALDKAIKNLDVNYQKVLGYKQLIVNKLKNYHEVVIHDKNSIPHILNISIMNFKPEVFLHMLEQDDVYISVKSACSINSDYSLAVLEYSSSMEEAMHSVRISLSAHTTEEQILKFLEVFDKCIKRSIK